MAIPELCALGAVELQAKLTSGETSSVEVVSAHLDQIEAQNPKHNAIVSLRPREDILAEAALADEARKLGATDALLGLPVAFKDLQPTKGLRTTFGSPLFADFVPAEDSLMVARVRAAGAILIGKTNTPEFGLGSHTYNTVFGRTKNAFYPALSAGGSSGGAAVSLALRMLPVADGSDFGGSLRNPGAFNNVFGLRPSLGRVPNVPSKDGFFAQMSTDGPMARSVADLALMLSVMAGYDPRSPLALGELFDAALKTSDSAPRVAWLGDLGGRLPTEPGVLDLCSAALSALEPAGWRTETLIPAFDYAALWRAFVRLRQFAALGTHGFYRGDPKAYAQLKPEMQWELEEASKLSADDVAAAAAIRSQWRETALGLLETYDVLALPSAQVFPFPVDWDWPKEIAGRAMDSYHRWFEVAAPASLTGFPAVNVPAGFHPDGRPMGVQLIGRPRGEAELLAIAAAYEATAPRA
ncbi:amidase [Hansschlegelia zhihuaiae]|uniref:Indoleacetamide hydrolase n=1 Tax=Hansschlegelia zhihuaiae TaxID=405005 RepID=A0A4Q0M6L7_9HYPH|nr:amidase [Hansschlegelia zhihuaiae]